jgi:ADP-ribosylation factor-like protein 1
MGNIFGKLLDRVIENEEIQIIMVGLDGVGKTTILNKLQIGKVVTINPTIGIYSITLLFSHFVFFQEFSIETVEYKHTIYSSWDIYDSASSVIRSLWRCYVGHFASVFFFFFVDNYYLLFFDFTSHLFLSQNRPKVLFLLLIPMTANAFN